MLPFPLCGNGLSKSLDSGLRRNDGEGNGSIVIILLIIATQKRYQGIF